MKKIELASIFILLAVVIAHSGNKESLEEQRKSERKVLAKRQLDFNGGGGGVNDYVNGDLATEDMIGDEDDYGRDEDYESYDDFNGDEANDFWRSVRIFIAFRFYNLIYHSFSNEQSIFLCQFFSLCMKNILKILKILRRQSYMM